MRNYNKEYILLWKDVWIKLDYIVFFNYENGTREFGYYEDYEEAKERYDEALKDAKTYGSRVEIGIAEIVDVHKNYISDLG